VELSFGHQECDSTEPAKLIESSVLQVEACGAAFVDPKAIEIPAHDVGLRTQFACGRVVAGPLRS
jgi:hypothetical protein